MDQLQALAARALVIARQKDQPLKKTFPFRFLNFAPKVQKPRVENSGKQFLRTALKGNLFIPMPV